MHKYLTEFIGTFFLVLTIGLAGLSGSILAPLAIGSSLMVMVYMGGHVSGAHYNPAVSLAVLLRGKLGLYDCTFYMLVQVLGAMLAAFAVFAITGNTFAPKPAPANPNDPMNFMPALLVEFLYTFALALVVLSTATAKKATGNSYFGLAIGFTVTAAAFAGGGISGGAYNPAVGVGPAAARAILETIQDMALTPYEHLWLYLVGPFAGGALAAGVFYVQEAGSTSES